MVGRREDFLRGGSRTSRSPEIPPMRTVSLVDELVLQVGNRAAAVRHARIVAGVLPTQAVKVVGLLVHL